jgi:hypothetical protein
LPSILLVLILAFIVVLLIVASIVVVLIVASIVILLIGAARFIVQRLGQSMVHSKQPRPIFVKNMRLLSDFRFQPPGLLNEMADFHTIDQNAKRSTASIVRDE